MNTRFTILLLISVLPFALNAQCLSGDCQDGEGTYLFKDNSSYTGEFKGGMAEGYGICSYQNGNKYMGHWKAHSFHGEGTFYYANNEVLKAIWENGELLKKLKFEKTEELAYVPKIWSVVVGVAAYHHMRRLQYTDDDAYKMYAFLKSPEGGAIPDEQIKILVDESATKQRIIETMKEVLFKANEKDIIMFYFSGHGKEDSFLPYDFDGENNKLTFNEINTIFGLSKAKHKFCIADACHSGGMLASKGNGSFGELTSKDYFAEFGETSQTAIMVSSQMDEQSVESATLRQGTFSHFLIKGLKGNADRDRDNQVTISELFDYVNRQVKAYTSNYQNPLLFGNYDPNIVISTVNGAAKMNKDKVLVKN
ncbi:MAG: caspase family protein [Saprospiraceae bacterium]